MIQLNNVRPGEKVVKILKVHWISYLVLGIHIFATIMSSIVIHIVFGITALAFIFSILIWLISITLLYIEWINYELDMLVITNNRIIGIEQVSFLNRSVSECNLSQIQEVNSKTKGFFSNLFNYGDVSIQTAGNVTSITLKMCPDVIKEQRNIFNIVEKYKNSNITEETNNEKA